MQRAFRLLTPVFAALLALVACGGAQPEPAVPNGSAAEPSAPGDVAPESSGSRPSMTAQECEASGGTVVGDIGDGAIHRPDYVCASGSKPRASIRATEGAPIAIEGNVCCPK